MSHTIGDLFHTVTDDDGIFNINPSTREITYERAGGVDYFGGPVLVKGDHNSERLTFKIPMVIEGHDMSTCNLIRVHYIAIDSATSAQYKDAYDIPLSDRSKIGDDYFSFNWLVDRNVTKSAGQVSFVIQFACTRETTRNETVTDAESGETTVVEKTISIIDYSWSTIPYSELRVSEGYINDKQDAENFEDEYSSIVAAWHNEIESAIARSDAKKISNIEQTTTSTEDGGTNVLTITLADGTESTFEIQNGKTGGDGADGLSAYQVAVNNGFGGSEQEWLDSLKAIGYADCLKGVTLTQAEYDSLSEAEKNREDFAYIIKSETLHADTADHASTADNATNASHSQIANSATVAAGYTEDGEIANAISKINTSITSAEKKLDTIIAGPTTESDNVSIPYNIQTVVENGSSYIKFFGTEQLITAPENCVFTQVSIESVAANHSASKSSVSATISEDGKTIAFNMTGSTAPSSNTTGTATVNYSCTIEFLTNVYHAHYAQIADNAISANNLTFRSITYTNDGSSFTSVNVNAGRAYIVSLNIGDSYGDYTGMIHIPTNKGAHMTVHAATSSVMGIEQKQLYQCHIQYRETEKDWAAYVFKSNQSGAPERSTWIACTFTLIEL